MTEYGKEYQTVRQHLFTVENVKEHNFRTCLDSILRYSSLAQTHFFNTLLVKLVLSNCSLSSLLHIIHKMLHFLDAMYLYLPYHYFKSFLIRHP